MKESITNSNSKKLKILVVLAFITITAMIFVPTFGRYVNRTSFYNENQWDGSIATSYNSGNGTQNSPYIISNGSEFAYFINQLKTTNYSGTYFQLSKDIILNRGTFEYDGTINYTLNDITYQIDEYGKQITDGFNLNTIEQSNEFAGTFNGNYYRIYGLYMTSETNENLALFNNLTGTVNNLYLSNTMIYGKTNASALTINSTSATITNVMVDGNVVGLSGNASTLSLNSSASTFTQIVNKAYVYGKTKSAGLILSANADKFKSGYNIGHIQSDGYASGLFDTYVGTIELANFYNDGEIESPTSSQFINSLSQGNLTGCFATKDEYLFNNVSGWGLSFSNSATVYNKMDRTGKVSGSQKTLAQITQIDNLQNQMGFSSFDEQSSSKTATNQWKVLDGQIPKLTIDEMYSSYGKIQIDNFTWNNFSVDLNTLKFRDSFTVNISVGDLTIANAVKNPEVGYYIQKSSTPLTYSQVSNEGIFGIGGRTWTTYNNPVTFTEPGTYIIYARVRAARSTNQWWPNYATYYFASDIITLTNDSLGEIKVGDFTYTNLSTTPRRVYLDEEKDIQINMNSDYIDRARLMYYATTDVLTEDELNELSTVWNLCPSEMKLTSKDSKIYYFKLYDHHDKISYISTDSLSVNGYNQNTIKVGRNLSDEDNVSISDKSTISFNYTFSDTGVELSNYTKNIVTNALLPENTKITIIDNINNKVYTHITDNSSYGYTNDNKLATYPFNKFKEISTTNLYQDKVITGDINDDYTIKLNFENTNITQSIENVNITLRILDNNSNTIVPTLKKSIKTFSIIKDSASSISISSNYQGSIDYNRDNSNSIDFKINIDKKDGVVDSTYEDQVYGLQIKMINEDTKEIMDRTYLSNLMFKYKDKSYPAYKDGIVNINLGTDTQGNLILDTYMLKDKIEGNYAFYICPYASYDGINNSDIPLNTCISIPINIIDNFKEQYVFDVVLESDDRILTKNEDKTLNFEIIYQGELKNPNIRVSLYEKNEYTAYDQTYSIVDLKDFVYGEYTHIGNKLYYLDDSIETTKDFVNYSISFNNTNFKLNGYKLIFDLYSEDRKIGSIEKRFIVKGDK